ncbi:MAG TPA: cytochrome c [Bdellovibrionota bacterium]|nr:cytochrome c [Bdellovibrionota bacterium]
MLVGLSKTRTIRLFLLSLLLQTALSSCFARTPNGNAATVANPVVPVSENDPLTVVLNSGPQGSKTLKAWDLPAFQKLKSASTREKDPETGEVVSWRGPMLSHLIDQALEGLTVAERAQIDLVILRNAKGTQAFVPRFLISRYPLMMAWERGSREPGLGPRGPWYSIVPWTSKPRILEEQLPLERYFVPGLRQIELTNYRNLYSAYFLKKQTDPLAMRGEKIFMQNCLGCHNPSQAPNIASADPTKSRVLATQGQHATVKGVPQLEAKQWRALINYFEAFRSETAGGTASASQ